MPNSTTQIRFSQNKTNSTLETYQLAEELKTPINANAPSELISQTQAKAQKGTKQTSGKQLYQELMQFDMKVNKDLDQMNWQVNKLKNVTQIANKRTLGQYNKFYREGTGQFMQSNLKKPAE